ncbi:hypothetical protein EKD04_003245 [Chloroflexales bacterium ZM16-3]|nr:hypothetical protein [Chloroflexales bacterium ZM16-3]
MSLFLTRALATLMIAVLLAAQARRVPARSFRRAAFICSAVAFALFALGNWFSEISLGSQIIQAISIAGVAMIGASLLLMVRAYTSGEMREKLRRAQQMVAEERARTKER